MRSDVLVLFLLVSLIVAVIALALVAGYVLAYANSVMPGLARADDRSFVVANQRVNEAVHNPLFMGLSNLAPLALLAALVAAVVGSAGLVVLGLSAAALVLYGVTLAVTLAINVPMNNKLIALGEVSDPAELARARTEFERPWVRMNLIRTWTTSLSAVAAAAAFLAAAAG